MDPHLGERFDVFAMKLLTYHWRGGMIRTHTAIADITDISHSAEIHFFAQEDVRKTFW